MKLMISRSYPARNYYNTQLKPHACDSYYLQFNVHNFQTNFLLCVTCFNFIFCLEHQIVPKNM